MGAGPSACPVSPPNLGVTTAGDFQREFGRGRLTELKIQVVYGMSPMNPGGNPPGFVAMRSFQAFAGS